MKNEGDIEFTPDATLPQGTDFAPELTEGSMGSDGMRRGSGAPMDQARQKAQALMSTAQSRASERINSQFDTQKVRAADSLSSVAQTLRGTTDGLPVDGVGKYINEAADRVDDLAHYLQDHELADVVGTVEDFARRQPMVFLGGAFALGVLGARFLRSSSSNARRRTAMDAGWRQGQTYDGHDAVGRPLAEGYARPEERADTSYRAPDPRTF